MKIPKGLKLRTSQLHKMFHGFEGSKANKPSYLDGVFGFFYLELKDIKKDLRELKSGMFIIHKDLKIQQRNFAEHTKYETHGDPYKVETRYHFRLANFGRALCVVGVTVGLLDPVGYSKFGGLSLISLLILNIYTSKASYYR